MDGFTEVFTGASSTYVNVYIAIFRWVAPVLAVILIFRCLKSLMTFRREPEIWAWLCFQDGEKLPVTHWENVIGRHKSCDLVIDAPTVSRNHAVLTRYDDGSWTIRDTDSKSGIFVNQKKVGISAIGQNDSINLGGLEMKLVPITARQEKRLAELRTKASGIPDSFANLMLLTVFQILSCIGILLFAGENGTSVLLGFGGLIVCQWFMLTFNIIIHRTAFELETIAFFLCTMGIAAIASVKPEEAGKQLIAIVMGIAAYLCIGWSLRDLERAKIVRRIAAVAGLGFLVITFLFGTEYYGAKNWIQIGPISFQLSELSKVCFVFAGASTMDRILNKRNLISFIIYSVILCGCLALMNDFGTALIFFFAFLIIAFLRSGSIGTIGLACTSLGFAGVVALRIAPHALRRFSTWRNIWSDPLGAGYQQTRAIMCIASGGLLGLGPGKGWMKNLFAADSDMVIATISEEWGLLMTVLLLCCIIALAVFAVRSAAVARSSFYTIGACTAAGIMLIQVILNALGTVDVLPLTGVTFPFVSNGGSSMIGAWGLLAFIKAADTRQNASFAVAMHKRRGNENE